jgi:hypothetical protein
MEALAVAKGVETHLREKRFFLNQLWQLFSALNKFVRYQLPLPYHTIIYTGLLCARANGTEIEGR